MIRDVRLNRVKEIGVSVERLVETYKLRIRVLLEQNVPLWMFSLNKKMCQKIEKVQKIALYIVLGKNAHKDYFCNLAILELDTLEGRREKIAFNFAHKLLKNPEHRKMFQFDMSSRTRHGNRVIVPAARTKRYEDSTVPSIAKLINDKLSHKI